MANSIEAIISGGGSPQAILTVHGDTIFVDPVKNFKHNEMITITCTKCKTIKNLSDFPKHKGRKYERDSWCIMCHREASKIGEKGDSVRGAKVLAPPSMWQR